MCKKYEKTNSDRMKTIQRICFQDIGACKAVCVKLIGLDRWSCKVKFGEEVNIHDVEEFGYSSTEAIKKMKKRIKKIVKRYNMV